MLVTIKRVDTTLPLPQYHTAGAVAFDLVARETVTLPSNGVGRVPANIIVKTPPGYMLFLKERSSTAEKKGIFCTAGLVDQDYCGENDEIKLQFYNFQSKPVVVERGDRLAQAVFVRIERAEWNEVETMSATSRGGFGTTG